MRVKTTLAIVLAIVLPLTAAMVGDNVSAAGNIPGLQGSGTASDPYLVTSAADLRTVSDSYRYHSNAYYLQTKDITFTDDPSGYKMYVDITFTGTKASGRITTNAKTINNETSATIIVNGCNIDAVIRSGFIEFEFDRSLLCGNDNVTAAGIINGNMFGVSSSFSYVSGNISFSSPLTGNFKPIGTAEIPFTGSYNGNGYSIKGIKVVSADGCAGMFGYIGNASITGVRILSEQAYASYFITRVNDSISYTNTLPPVSVGRSSFAGGIAAHGTSGSTISMCSSGASVLSELDFSRSGSYPESTGLISHKYSFDVATFSSAGGICGYGAGNIYGCENNGPVTSVLDSYYSWVLKPIIYGASNTYICDFDVSMCNYAGGIVGYSDIVTLSASGNSGYVSALTDTYFRMDYERQIKNMDLKLNESFASVAGGIAGCVRAGSISDAYNTASVSSIYAFEHATSSWTTDSNVVSLSFDTAAGGIAGAVYGNTVIRRAYNNASAAASGTASSFIPLLKRTADERYAGEIIGAVRNVNVKIENSCYAQRAKNNPVAGNKTYSAAKISGTLSAGMFPGWDLAKVWDISGSYPKIWIRNELKIVDRAGAYYGVPMYSVNVDHQFDVNGTLSAYIDRNGFSLTLAEDYKNSKIRIYMTDGGVDTEVVKNASGKYEVPAAKIIGASPITLYIDGLAADPVRDLTIIDTSVYYGDVRYTISTNHSFDASGNLHGKIDKNGFSISLKQDYAGSNIEVYFFDGTKKTVIPCVGGKYTMPIGPLMRSSSVTLYIGGLVADPIRELTMIDTSGVFYGDVRYTISTGCIFNGDGELHGTVDKKGFSITLSDDYRTSNISVSMRTGSTKTPIPKGADGKYVIPIDLLLKASEVTLYLDGLAADPKRELTMIDTSGTFDGSPRYSVSIGSNFDGAGELHGTVDKKGFSITLAEDYKTSTISISMRTGGTTTPIPKGADGKYVIPMQLLIKASEVTLYIDGLAADPIRDLTIVDTGAPLSGCVKYSVDIGHVFDPSGSLRGRIDKNGFSITLAEDYKRSAVVIYYFEGSNKIFIPNTDGRYVMPLAALLRSQSVTLYIDGLVADPIRNMTIYDTSGTFDGTLRYTADIDHEFDDDGTLRGVIDKNGLSIALCEGFDASVIEVYMISGDGRMVIAADGCQRYAIPLQTLLSSPEITLYIDGLAPNPAPPEEPEEITDEETEETTEEETEEIPEEEPEDITEEVPKEIPDHPEEEPEDAFEITARHPDVLSGSGTGLIVDPPAVGLGTLAFICVLIFIGFGASVTILNALRARSILRISERKEKKNGQ